MEYLQRIDEKKYSSENIIDNVIELASRNKKECPNSITKLILDNKFLDLNWEIIFDDSSDQTPNMSQIKILVKIFYLNLSNMKKSELNLILNEEEQKYLSLSKRYLIKSDDVFLKKRKKNQKRKSRLSIVIEDSEEIFFSSEQKCTECNKISIYII